MHRPSPTFPVPHRIRSAASLAALVLLVGAWTAPPRAATHAPREPQCPAIDTTGAPRLKLSPDDRRALVAAVPGFAPCTIADYAASVRSTYHATAKQAPWAVVGDFDGDGFCDLVVDGRTPSDFYRLCAWGSAKGLQVMTLGRRRLRSRAPITSALTLVPQYTITAHSGDEGAHGDGFAVASPGGRAQVYYWHNSRFAHYRAD